MDLLRRWFKSQPQGSGQELPHAANMSPGGEVLNIVVVPIEEPSSPKITRPMVLAAWPRAIDSIPDMNENIKSALTKRVYALNLTNQTAVLYVDDEELFATLQQTSHYCNAIARTLTEILGVTIDFQITNVITISLDSNIEEDAQGMLSYFPSIPFSSSALKNTVDRAAQALFSRMTHHYSLLSPEDGGVYTLPLTVPNLDLHWFQVATKAIPHEHFDVFCLFAPHQPSQAEQMENSLRGVHPDTQPLFRPEVLAEMAQRIGAQVSQERPPVSNTSCFLFVPAFPRAGIHVLTRPFDLSPISVTPILFPVTVLSSMRDDSSLTQIFQRGMENWQERANRYLRFDPVTGEDYYRQDNIEATIQDCIRRGQTFGLFGLRRIGKTSLLHEMARKRAFGPICFSLLNLQAYLHRPIWHVLRDAILDWTHALAPLLAESGRAQLAQLNPELAVKHQEINVLARSMHDLLRLLPDQMRLVLILDEVGELLPAPPDYQQASFPHWREFLAFLRSIYYDSSGRFVLGVATYRDDIAYNNLGDGNRNPWLQQIKAIPLGPLSQADCERMVQDIGGMAGLYYTPEALQLLYKQTYGHPQITRELCNAVAEDMRRVPHEVTPDELQRVIDQFFHKNPTLRAMYEGLHPKEQAIVQQLAAKGEVRLSALYQRLAAHFGNNKQAFNDTITPMEGYGLVHIDDKADMLYLSLGILETYMRKTFYSGELQ